jgi:hypothetical protein
MMCSGVQSRDTPVAARKRSRRARPLGVWRTSGWNCRPKRAARTSSIAAIGVSSVAAVTTKPGGGVVTLSPWLIHATNSPSTPSNRLPPYELKTALPYSRLSARATSPPSSRASRCMP